MPITKSAKKALLVDRRRKAENDVTRARVKNALKGAKIAVRDGNKEATGLISAAYRELDIAAKKNVIHKNKAARLKSRLTKKIDGALKPAATKKVKTNKPDKTVKKPAKVTTTAKKTTTKKK